MARVCILNWTAGFHAGSAAACEALEGLLDGHEIVERVPTGQHATEEFSGAEVVICNGEGTLHHGRPVGQVLVDELARAQSQRLRAALVNATWQANPQGWADVVGRCAFVAVREPRSAVELKRQGVRAGCWPDLSLLALERPSVPGPFAGEVVLGYPGAAPHSSAWEDLMRRHPTRVGLRYGRTLQSVVDDLAGAALYVTGEFHGVCAAAAAGVDVAAFPSNSWKIESTVGWWISRGDGVRFADWLWAHERMNASDLAGVLA